MQVREVAEIVRQGVTGSTVSLAAGAGPDQRNYRVDFSKLATTFPDLTLRWSIPAGVDELVRAYTDFRFDHADFTSSRYVRLRRIRELLSAGLVDDLLRRQPEALLDAPGDSLARGNG